MATSCDTIMIRGLPLHITEQHVSDVMDATNVSNLSKRVLLQVQDNIMSHGLKAQDIRLIRKKDTGKVQVCVA